MAFAVWAYSSLTGLGLTGLGGKGREGKGTRSEAEGTDGEGGLDLDRVGYAAWGEWIGDG